MKKLILLGACLLAFTACPAQAVAAAEPDIVVVRLSDGTSGVDVVITRGENKVEYLTFKSGYNEKGLTASGQGYYKIFHKLYQEGYTLQSTFNGGTSIQLTTLLFVKAK